MWNLLAAAGIIIMVPTFILALIIQKHFVQGIEHRHLGFVESSILDVQDTVGTVFNGVPSINTNEIQTEVLVDNGQTVVLGGIFQTDKNVSTTKTPFLGDLPYVGRLFKRTVERDDKQELLIFITPRIIADTLTDR